METCRICTESTAAKLPVAAAPTRTYWLCRSCEAVYVSPDEHLSSSEEAKFYGLHENSPSDPRYRNYLNPIMKLAWEACAASTRARAEKLIFGDKNVSSPCALDFGSGPLKPDEESVVCEFFRDKGFVSDAYDPYFRPMDISKCRYDVIVACEVFEHFRSPSEEIERLVGLLRDGGVLAIQTEFFPGIGKFDSWYYRRDPTHVVFYSPRTFEVLAKRFGLSAPEFYDGKRVLFRKACQEISNPVS